jgi:hypothetical protein
MRERLPEGQSEPFNADEAIQLNRKTRHCLHLD